MESEGECSRKHLDWHKAREDISQMGFDMYVIFYSFIFLEDICCCDATPLSLHSESASCAPCPKKETT
jgi:hypothetical protein